MRLGGLFSGIGGFELAWTQLGHEVAWMCEIDRSARKVLAARFPGVPIYDDVQQLDPAEVAAVDVLTGGSPCQGFSVAGTRSGLEHGESRLFADYIRVMEGLSDRGLQWALWENVPGVLSICNDDGEMTYEHVVAALVGATEPVRLGQGRWNTGLADRGGRAVAWRVLDSRYFGVAQRRRRLFACVAFGGVAADRAGRALLAKPDSVQGNPDTSDAEREGVAEGVASGAYPAGSPIAFDWQMHSNAGTLPSTERTPALSANKTPAVLMTMREGCDGGGKGPLLVEEESLTLATGNGQTLFQPQAFRKAARAQSVEDDESWVADGQANTLNTFDMGDTRTTHAIVESANYGVRRLTPVECERLQAFPDGWTEPAGSDSARYKALGNAVTVNTVRWVLGRMLGQS